MHHGIRRRDGNSSEAIAAILNPHEGYREKLKKRGITPKDYERENKLRLKQMQRQNREQRLREGAARREAFKLTRFKGVRPRVFKTETNEAQSPPQSKHAFLRRGDAAHQPAEPPPSKPAPAQSEPKPTRVVRKEPVPSLDELEARSRELVAKMTLKEKTDFVNANAWDVIRKPSSKSPVSPAPAKPSEVVVPAVGKAQSPPLEHKPLAATAACNRNFGRIPKYLLERKEQWAREEEERRRNAPDPDCPPGMMLLDEDERQRTLQVLRKSLDEARWQMNHLPLRIETPSQIRRKCALEAKLQEIEDAIRVFDRAKVYVAIPLELQDKAPAPPAKPTATAPTKPKPACTTSMNSSKSGSKVTADRDKRHHALSGAAA